MIEFQGKFYGWENKGVYVAYIQVIKDMYDRATTSMRIQGGVREDFSIKIGLHHESFLSLYLFTLVLDVFTLCLVDWKVYCVERKAKKITPIISFGWHQRHSLRNAHSIQNSDSFI